MNRQIVLLLFFSVLVNVNSLHTLFLYFRFPSPSFPLFLLFSLLATVVSVAGSYLTGLEPSVFRSRYHVLRVFYKCPLPDAVQPVNQAEPVPIINLNGIDETPQLDDLYDKFEVVSVLVLIEPRNFSPGRGNGDANGL